MVNNAYTLNMILPCTVFNVLFLFDITAAGVMPRGGPKKVTTHSSLVHIILLVWFFEIEKCTLRIRK